MPLLVVSNGYLDGVSEDVNEASLIARMEPTRATDMRALLAEPSPQPELTAVIAERYRIERLLGNGGMADVVLATDLVLHREVAVKLLRDTTDTEGDLARFLAETSTLARLSHPGLVTVLDGGTTSSGRPYLVMELVDGPPLSASLEEPLDAARVAEVGAQVAAALSYAHTQGVVHRDVKPGNVLVRSDGRIKLADFGIAKLLGDHSRHTRTGTVVGSVHYLAPEQVAYEEITTAVDVYGLGLMLLRCLTGQHAFDGPTIESALARLSADPVIPADLPAAWRDLLTAMTARAPGDRPSAAEVAGRLSRLAGTPTASRVLPPRPLDQPTVPVRPVRHVGDGARQQLAATWTRLRVPPAVVGAAVLAVALLVAAAVAGKPAASDDPAPSSSPSALVEESPETGDLPVQAVGELEPVADTVVSAAASMPLKVKHHPKASTTPRRSTTSRRSRRARANRGSTSRGRASPAKPRSERTQQLKLVASVVRMAQASRTQRKPRWPVLLDRACPWRAAGRYRLQYDGAQRWDPPLVTARASGPADATAGAQQVGGVWSSVHAEDVHSQTLPIMSTSP